MDLRRRIETAVLTLHESPAGRQVMTVFQGERLEKHPLSCLESARALLADQAGNKQQGGKSARPSGHR